MNKLVIVKTNPFRYGFYHYMQQVILGLYYGYKYDRPVVIDFRLNHPYQSMEEGVNNVWDNYFEQPYGILAEDAYRMRDRGEIEIEEDFWFNTPELCCIGNLTIPPNSNQIGGVILPKNARQLGSIGAKRIIPKGSTKQIIDDFYDSYMKNHKILGVHRRGISHAIAGIPEHILTDDEIFAVIDGMIDNYDKIFLATPQNDQPLSFLRKYGSRVLFRKDVCRHDPECHADVLLQDPTSNFRLGQEVIVDTFLLSKCDIFLRGFSGVADGVCFLNENLPYVHVNIPTIPIDKELL